MRRSDALDRFQRDAHLWVPHYLTAEHFRLADRLGRPVDVYPPGFEFLSQRATGSEMRRVIGHDGAPVVSGDVELFDHNYKLPPETWRGTYGRLGRYDEMRRSNPVIGAIVTAFETYLSTAPWPDVKPKGTDRPALEMARFLRAALFEYSATPWRSQLRHYAHFPLSGTALAEVTWRVDRDMGKAYGLSGPMVTIADVKPRRLNTVNNWLKIVDRTTTATRWMVEQWPSEADPALGETETFAPGERLHPDKLVHLPWSNDGEAPEGVGMLRACHADWALSQTLMKAQATGADRASTGVPYFRVVPGYGRENDATLRQILQEYRAGARSNLGVIPEGVEIGFAEMPFKGEMVDKALKSSGMAIARACSMPWLFTGVDNGTEALMRSQMLTTKAQLRAAMQQVVDVWCYGPHAHGNRLLRANWGDVPLEELPSLEVPDVHLGDPMALVELFATAIASGTLTADGGLEAQVRQVAGAAEMPEETAEAWEHKLKNAAPPEIEAGGGVAADDDDTGDDAEDQGDEAGKGAPSDDDDGADDAAEQREEMRSLFQGAQGDLDDLMNSTGLSLAHLECALHVAMGEPLGRPDDNDCDEGCSHDVAPASALRTTTATAGGELVAGPGGRPLTNLERCIRLRETKAAMQGAREEIGQIVERWRDKAAEAVVADVMQGDSLIVSDVRKATVPAQGKLAQQIEDVLRGAYRAGADSVEAELDRQAQNPSLVEKIEEGEATAGEGGDVEAERPSMTPLRALALRSQSPPTVCLTRRPIDQPDVVAEGESIADAIDPERSIRAVVATTVDAIVARLKEELGRLLQAASLGGVIGGDQFADLGPKVTAALKALSLGKDLAQAQRDSNTMFGLGRIQKARSLEDAAPVATFSNLIESQTCGPCERANGRRVGPDELDEYATPYSQCEGGDMCNCLLIFTLR